MNNKNITIGGGDIHNNKNISKLQCENISPFILHIYKYALNLNNMDKFEWNLWLISSQTYHKKFTELTHG